MNRRLDELWLDALETKVDGQVVVYLKKNHPDYQDAFGILHDRRGGSQKD